MTLRGSPVPSLLFNRLRRAGNSYEYSMFACPCLCRYVTSMLEGYRV